MDSQRRRETSGRLTYQWRKLDLMILRDRLKELPTQLRPRPISERFWLDVIFLLLVCTVQLCILPQLFFNLIYIDLVTPWLAYIFVMQRGEKSLVIALIAALMLETYTLAPMGLYFCIYPLMLAIIVTIREPLSWRHATPWAVTLGVSLAAVAIAEALIRGIIIGSLVWPFITYIEIIARILLSWVSGMMIIFYFLDREVKEEIS
jgi:cell shape-determining protein MreD